MSSADAVPSYSGVTVRYQGHVAHIQLDRGDGRNAISSQLAQSIAAACSEVGARASVRAVVLSSAAASAFSVGADLKERARFTTDELLAQRPTMRAAFAGVAGLPQPTIAAIAGHALGGGAELALSCDLIVADETAVIGLPEVSVGLVPGGGGTQLLARRVGYNRAADLIFTGRRLDAAQAYRLGVVDRLVATGKATEVAAALAEQIAANSPVGVRAAKRALSAGIFGGLTDGLAEEDRAWHEVAVSADRREGIAAFVEKRPPVWAGE